MRRRRGHHRHQHRHRGARPRCHTADLPHTRGRVARAARELRLSDRAAVGVITGFGDWHPVREAHSKYVAWLGAG
eukprot:scaffold8831_cov135-Isochrysis_galbana.AAC.8